MVVGRPAGRVVGVAVVAVTASVTLVVWMVAHVGVVDGVGHAHRRGGRLVPWKMGQMRSNFSLRIRAYPGSMLDQYLSNKLRYNVNGKLSLPLTLN